MLVGVRLVETRMHARELCMHTRCCGICAAGTQVPAAHFMQISRQQVFLRGDASRASPVEGLCLALSLSHTSRQQHIQSLNHTNPGCDASKLPPAGRDQQAAT